MTRAAHPSKHKVPKDVWEPYYCKNCPHPVYDSAPKFGCVWCMCGPGDHVQKGNREAGEAAETEQGPETPQ